MFAFRLFTRVVLIIKRFLRCGCGRNARKVGTCIRTAHFGESALEAALRFAQIGEIRTAQRRMLEDVDQRGTVGDHFTFARLLSRRVAKVYFCNAFLMLE